MKIEKQAAVSVVMPSQHGVADLAKGYLGEQRVPGVKQEYQAVQKAQMIAQNLLIEDGQMGLMKKYLERLILDRIPP
jgi:hypothetical protein